MHSCVHAHVWYLILHFTNPSQMDAFSELVLVVVRAVPDQILSTSHLSSQTSPDWLSFVLPSDNVSGWNWPKHVNVQLSARSPSS